jgi:TPR repeat protein
LFIYQLFRSGTIEDATAAYNRRYATDSDCGSHWLKGDAKAQYNLGVMYDCSQGIHGLHERISTEVPLGTESQKPSITGLMYYQGQATAELRRGSEVLQKGCRAGLPIPGELGIMYYHGQGVSQDYVLAHMGSICSPPCISKKT